MFGVASAARRSTSDAAERWRSTVDDAPIAVAWSPAGDRLAVLGADGALWVLDAADGQVVWQAPAHRLGGADVGWSRDGATLATAGHDGVARLWDGRSGAPRADLDAGAAWVERLAWSPAHDLVATAAGKVLRLWTHAGERVAAFADHPSTIADIAWRPDRREVTAATYGGLTIWDPAKAEPVTRHAWQGSTLVIAWSPDGKYIATGDQDATVHFWIARTGLDLQMWGYPSKVRELSWHHTSRYLATGGGSSVTIWDCGGKGPEGRRPLVLDGHDAPLAALAYQHGGGCLASACQDGNIVLWQPTRQRRPIGSLALPAGAAQLAWSPDDRLLAASAADGSILVLSAPTSA